MIEKIMGYMGYTIFSIGETRITVLTVLLCIVIIVLLVALFILITRAYRIYLSNKFRETYKVKLQDCIEVRRRKTEGRNYFLLRYPVWEFPNLDGSCDRRRARNHIVDSLSELYIDGYYVLSSSPVHLVWLINVLRKKRGVQIDKSDEERKKLVAAKYGRDLVSSNQSVLEIVKRFQETPTDFEEYCACLYRIRGYEARVTPRSCDGGYDIELKNTNGERSIVECKCYDLSHKIGRDLVQKLVGANAERKAENMIFITTSDYSAEAREYARKVNVELVNGNELVRMVRDCGQNGYYLKEVSDKEWSLTLRDLTQYYPPDYLPPQIDLG